jgi:pimeloyl-ACP methyl ester carboxylesterase
MKYSLKESYNRLERDNYSILSTKEFGNIQYKQINGITDNIAVLLIHGITGGYDQGLITGNNLLPQDNTMISISRFGYLKSDIPTNPSPINQCMAYKAVLDYLGVDKVVLLATSAGGTIAFKFALTYPDCTAGIILIGSGYPDLEKSKGPLGPPSFIYNDYLFEYMLNHMQGIMLKMFGISLKEYQNGSQSEKRGVNELFNSIIPIKPRKSGILNDKKRTNSDMTVHFNDYPIENITSPILILHAKNDPMAKYDKMIVASKRLQKVTINEYETGGHILFGHNEETSKRIARFLQIINEE